MSTARVMMAISDKKSFYLLTKIAFAEVDSEFLLSETKLTAKAFYSRMSRLKIGIITRKSGKYSLTSFGKIVYHAQDLIDTGLNNYWRLSALDSLGMIDALPTMEYNKISNSLLGDSVIEKIIARQLGVKAESPICLNAIPINTQGARKYFKRTSSEMKNSSQCLTLLDDLEYFALDSISDDILYRSIKVSLEAVGKTYAKAVIDHICHINRLSEREILTNCGLFEDSMYRLFGRGAQSVINKVKVVALRYALTEQKSNLTVPEILDPSLTINDVLKEIRSIEALDFVHKMSSYNHIAYLYSSKVSLSKILSDATRCSEGSVIRKFNGLCSF